MFNRRRWRTAAISDPWFASHFHYAADTVLSWLSDACKVRGARLLDFGCGDGITALGVSLKGQPASLCGIDLTRGFDGLGAFAREQLGLEALPENLRFRQITPGAHLFHGELDALYSWSVFEHIDPAFLEPVSRQLIEALRPGGVAFIQIEPLYYSAFGSHLQRLVQEPWAHLLEHEEALAAQVLGFEGALAASDRDLAAAEGVTSGFKRWLWQEYLALNRLRADDLVALLRRAGFEILREQRFEHPRKPPPGLLERFAESDLRINEIRLLARRP